MRGIGTPWSAEVSSGVMFHPRARAVYDRNVSATRLDPGAFIPYDNFGIGIAQPTMADREMAYYRLDAWSRTMDLSDAPLIKPRAMFSE